MIRGLDHINIATDKLQETRDFFVEVLGLEEGPRPGFDFPGFWLYAGGRAIVHLMAARGPAGGTRESALNHVAFEVGDLEDLVARLDRGGTPYRKSQPPGAAVRQVFIEDPNGVLLELNARI